MSAHLISGIELGNPSLAEKTARENIPVMISANRLWNAEKETWRIPDYLRNHPKLHLDSGGFVAGLNPGPNANQKPPIIRPNQVR